MMIQNLRKSIINQVAVLKQEKSNIISKAILYHSLFKNNTPIQSFTSTTASNDIESTTIQKDKDFILQKYIIENNDQFLLRKENYEIIFPEDSKKYNNNNLGVEGDNSNENNLANNEQDQDNIEYYTTESHLTDLLMYLHQDIPSIKNHSNDQSISTNDNASNTQSAQQQSAIRKIQFFNANLKNISKNCTSSIIEKLLQVIDLYPQIPQHLNNQYSRKIQQAIQTVFYRDLGVPIPLNQLRKILFFTCKYRFAVSPSLAQNYFSYHTTSNNNTLESTNQNNVEQNQEQQQKDNLKFDNIVDIIIYQYLKREYPLLAQNEQINNLVLENMEEMVKGINDKKTTFKFMSFLMLYSELIQRYTYANPAVQPTLTREKQLIKDVSDIIFKVLHQIKIAEQKVEVLLLFALAGEKEKADFYLPVVKDHVKLNIDMLNFNDEFKQIVCQHISLLKINHEQTFQYIMSIFLEWNQFTTKSLNCLFNPRNNIAVDLPFTVKQSVFKDIDNDSKQARSIKDYLQNINNQSQIKYVHPSLRFRISFQCKLTAMNKFIKQFQYKEDAFLRVIKDIEEYDQKIIQEELLFNGISQLFFFCQKMRIEDSILYKNMEDNIINIFENHSFEDYQLKLGLTILISYANSQHALSARFLETSLIFISYNLNRFDINLHNLVYRYLNLILMRTHEQDFGIDITFQSHIRQNFAHIYHQLNKINLNEQIKQLKIQSFVLKSFYTTLKIVAKEWYEKNIFAQEFLEQKTIGNEINHAGLMESSFAQEIQSVLDDMNIEYEKEKLIGFYFADFYLPKQNLILEVNGPHHYILFSENICQEYRLKKFHFNHMGYNVYDIPYVKFKDANQDKKSSLLQEIKYNLIQYISSQSSQ